MLFFNCNTATLQRSNAQTPQGLNSERKKYFLAEVFVNRNETFLPLCSVGTEKGVKAGFKDENCEG